MSIKPGDTTYESSTEKPGCKECSGYAENTVYYGGILMRTGRTILALFLGVLVLASLGATVRGGEPISAVAQTHFNLDPAANRVLGDLDYAADRPVLLRGQNDGSCCDEDVCCDDLSCEEGCCEDYACGDRCGPRWRIYGDFLYLRPRNAEVVYAVPFEGPITPPPAVPVQVGRIALVDPDYEPTFRVGVERYLDGCSSVGVSYPQLLSTSDDSISVDAPYVLRSMVIHPSSLNAAADWLSARANYDLSYKLADLDYRHVFICGPTHRVNYVAGIRYANLEQQFRSTFTILTDEMVNTSVNFDGGGIRVGLEGERVAGCTGFLGYARAMASFVAGEFRGNYFQGSDTDPLIANTFWKAGRIVPILDLELGVGWASCSGRFRVTGGYMVSAWYNTVTTTDWIGAVQHNDFSGLHDTMTFDGLVVRTELRY